MPQTVYFVVDRAFTQLDLPVAHLQLGLDSACRALTAISTHRGLFHYKAGLRSEDGSLSFPGKNYAVSADTVDLRQGTTLKRFRWDNCRIV